MFSGPPMMQRFIDDMLALEAIRATLKRKKKMTTKTTEQRIAELEAEIEKLKQDIKQPVRTSKKPEVGQVYFYIGEFFGIRKHPWSGGPVDLWRWHEGNVFFTEEEAETYIKVQNRYIELVGDWEPDWDNMQQYKYYLYCYHYGNCIDMDYQIHHQPNDKYMPEEAAETLLEERTTEELKIWLRVM